MTFDEVYERFKRPVWRLARRLTGSDEEALDATQEIFLRVWKGLSSFRGDAKLSTWVFQIAWNYLRARHRRSQRGLRAVESLDPDAPAVVDTLSDPAPGPERRTSDREQLEAVRRALAELPEHYRAVVWLRDGEGLAYDEIATVLEIPIGTVRSRLARARAALKEAIDR